MDLIVAPITVALNPQQQGAALAALKVGDIIEAQVLHLLGDGAAKLAIGKAVIDVQTQVALTPGTTVRLAVKTTPDGIRLALLGDAQPAPTPATSPAAAFTSPAPASAASFPQAAAAVAAPGTQPRRLQRLIATTGPANITSRRAGGDRRRRDRGGRAAASAGTAESRSRHCGGTGRGGADVGRTPERCLAFVCGCGGRRHSGFAA